MSHPPSTVINRRDMLRWLALGGAGLAALPLLRRTAYAAAAPALGGKQPTFYRFHAGDLEAVALHDGDISGPLKEMAWWTNIPEPELANALQAAYVSPAVVRLAITVMLVRTGDELVLVDSGCGGLFGPIGGHLTESLAAIGVRPEQITAVVLSHAHGDHFGGLLTAANAPTFPNARLIINQAEHAFWTQAHPDLSAVNMPDQAKRTSVENAQRYISTLKDRWHFVHPGDKPLPGFEIVDAPGHTPGHVAVLIGTGDERVLHVADAVHHHAVSFEHPDWQFIADVQPQVAEKTRRELLDRAARERLRIYGAHLPFPALGHVRKGDDRYEYVIEPWAPV